MDKVEETDQRIAGQFGDFCEGQDDGGGDALRGVFSGKRHRCFADYGGFVRGGVWHVVLILSKDGRDARWNDGVKIGCVVWAVNKINFVDTPKTVGYGLFA
jgi:hypothetical protein